MRLQRWIAQNILNVIEPHAASYVFWSGRDVLMAAERHCNCTWLVKMDIRSFFDSVRESQVYHVFRDLGYGTLPSFELARICARLSLSAQIGTVPRYDKAAYSSITEGRLPQGAPIAP